MWKVGIGVVIDYNIESHCVLRFFFVVVPCSFSFIWHEGIPYTWWIHSSGWTARNKQEGIYIFFWCYYAMWLLNWSLSTLIVNLFVHIDCKFIHKLNLWHRKPKFPNQTNLFLVLAGYHWKNGGTWKTRVKHSSSAESQCLGDSDDVLEHLEWFLYFNCDMWYKTLIFPPLSHVLCTLPRLLLACVNIL